MNQGRMIIINIPFQYRTSIWNEDISRRKTLVEDLRGRGSNSLNSALLQLLQSLDTMGGVMWGLLIDPLEYLLLLIHSSEIFHLIPSLPYIHVPFSYWFCPQSSIISNPLLIRSLSGIELFVCIAVLCQLFTVFRALSTSSSLCFYPPSQWSINNHQNLP